MAKEQEICPYCHTDFIYSGPDGMTEYSMPLKDLLDYSKAEDYFSFSAYVLNGELCFETQNRDGEYVSSIKIKYCPVCGRKL